MKKKVLYIQAIHAAGMDMLREKYDVVCPENEDKAFLLEAVKDSSAIVTRLTVVDKDIIAAGEKLEAIAKNGVGVDNIDVEAASARKIAVLTTGPANSLSVAEHTIFAMGAMLKKISYFDRAMHEGNWKCRDGGGFYDAEGRRTDTIDMVPGGAVINIPIGQWHNLKSLESGTVLLEVKDGLYEPIGDEDILRVTD